MSAWFAHVRRRRAATIALVVVVLPVLLGMAAIAIDIGYLSAMGAQFQNAADAAALAGVRELPDEWRARWIARRYARMNVNGETRIRSWWEESSDDGAEIHVEVGNWDDENQSFTAEMEPINAIKVVIRRDEKLIFAPVLGMDESTIEAESIALAAGVDCLYRGIIAGESLRFAKDTTLINYCAYGRDSVSFGTDCEILEDSKIGALDVDTISYGRGTIGLPEAIVESDTEPDIALRAADLIDEMEAGDWPFQIRNMVVGGALPAPGALLDGTLYIVNGNVTLWDVDIATRNVIIAVRGDLHLKRNATIRNAGFEGTDDAAIGILATGRIIVDKESIIENANLVAGESVRIKQEVTAFKASIQAAGDIWINKDPLLIDDFKSAFGGEGSLQSSSAIGELVK